MMIPLIVVLAVTSRALAAQVQDKDCPGVLEEDYCCVGGHLTLSNCKGWPICKGPRTVTQTSVSCSTKVFFSADDYDDVVSSASSKYLTDGWDATTTGSHESEQTADSSDSGNQDDSSSDGASAASKTDEASTSTGTDNGAFMPAATMLVPVAAGVMAAAALI